MSDNTNAAETTAIFTREDGSTYTVEKFSLAKTKEIADRFRGEHTLDIPLPVAVPGDLDATIRNLRAFVSPEANFEEVLVAKFVGQGLRLDLQKAAKDFLAPGNEELKDATVEDALASAQQTVNDERLGSPRKKGTGGSKGKVAQAEAKTAKVANTALDMYRNLPQAMRSNYRQALIDTGAVSAEELDAVDNEAPSTTGKGRK